MGQSTPHPPGTENHAGAEDEPGNGRQAIGERWRKQVQEELKTRGQGKA